MKSDEARDLGRAAGPVLRQLTGLVRGAHFAISDTVNDTLTRALGPSVRPIRAVSDAATAGVYATVGLALDAGSQVAGVVAAHRLQRQGDQGPSVHDGAGAHYALPISLGLRGDTIARDAVRLAPAMHLRHNGHQVYLDPEAITEAYGQVTAEIAVFLHGLFETERAWDLGTHDRASYTTRLSSDLGLTPVTLRFNTGLRISENALTLSEVLDGLVAAWPAPVERMVLIGHSMGGLVIHGALAAAADAADRGEPPAWTALVTDTVALGSPHHGSAIARAVAGAAHTFGQSPKGEWLADFLRFRSVGLRDLMHGNIVAADWEGHDPDDREDRRTHPLPYPDIDHYAVVGLIAGGRLSEQLADRLGDLVVDGTSASHRVAEPGRSRFGVDGVAVVPGIGHFALLNNNEVYAHLHRWLAATSPE